MNIRFSKTVAGALLGATLVACSASDDPPPEENTTPNDGEGGEKTATDQDALKKYPKDPCANYYWHIGWKSRDGLTYAIKYSFCGYPMCTYSGPSNNPFWCTGTPGSEGYPTM